MQKRTPMMNKRQLLAALFTPLCSTGMAQMTAVVYDIETHMPVSGVTVFVNPKGTATTDRYGRFFFGGRVHSVTLTHVAYEKRTMYRSEVRDTIFLLPKLNVVDSVVIIGNKPKIGFDVRGATHDATLSAPRNSGMSFDFFSIFQKKKKSRKEREKFNKLMRDYSK